MSLRSTVLAFALASTGCVGGTVDPSAGGADVESGLDSVCPTAPAGSLSLFRWRTTRQLEQVIWSSDGKEIGGVDYLFEEKRSWNPLDDTTLKRKYCHQLSRRDTKGALVAYVGPMQPNQAGEITFMQPAGYFTVQSYVRDPGGGWDFHRVALDGSRTLLAHVPVGCLYGRILPSPDGSRIAYFDVAGHCDDGGSGNDVKVSFLDGVTGQVIATSPSVHLPRGAAETWTPAGDLVLTDGATSLRVYLEGGVAKVAPAPLPHCTDPGTTSSTIAADGRTLGFDANGAPTIVSVDPAAAFGCQ